MRKILILILVLVPCLAAFSIGSAELEVHLDRNGVKAPDLDKGTITNVLFMPSVTTMLSEQKELQMGAIIGYYKENDPDDVSVADADYSQLSLGLGAGYYCRLFERERITVKAGPKAGVIMFLEPKGDSATDWDSFLDLEFDVLLPVFFDYQLTDSLFFRGGVDIPVFHFNIEKLELGAFEVSDRTLRLFDRSPTAFAGFGVRL